MSALNRAAMIALLMSLSLTGCAHKVGSLSFSGEGTRSAVMPLAAGKVGFWVDLDLSYEEPATLGYHIELLQAANRIAVVDCDPLGELPMKVGWIEIRRGASRSIQGGGRMSCFATLTKGGPTEVQATLAFGTRPVTATLKKIDLIVKQ